MKTVSRDWVFKKKYEDRQTVKELQYHADGAAVHIGQLSPGCRICFTGEQGGGIQIGNKCNRKCSVCYYDRGRDDEFLQQQADAFLVDHFRESLKPEWKPWSVAYQSAGETLMYLDQILPVAAVLRSLEKKRGIKIYHHLYSNGELVTDKTIDKMVAMNTHEFRFHCSASKWSDKMFANMLKVKAAGITLSVEEPSYPLERDNILDHLPIFEELGVKHLNLVEIQLTADNSPDIDKEYPDGIRYKDHLYHLYDEGLVYEVMRQVVDKGFSFSVLDCNSTVETYRQMKNQSLGFDKSTIEGMCAPFDYGDREETD